jgi:hypothetical protein
VVRNCEALGAFYRVEKGGETCRGGETVVDEWSYSMLSCFF